MSTIIRPEVSKTNKYWIDRHRYYELKHFCLQYSFWRKKYWSIAGLSSNSELNNLKSSNMSDPTFTEAEKKLFYSNRMDMIKNSAIETCEELSDYIFKAVTEGLSYEQLKARLEIPCCKDIYYKMYRRFFWLLSKARQ